MIWTFRDFLHEGRPFHHSTRGAGGPRPASYEIDPCEPGEATIRLAEARLLLEGRVLDLEGRPVAGARAKVWRVWAAEGGDLDALRDRSRGAAPRRHGRDRGGGNPGRQEGRPAVLILPMGAVAPGIALDKDGRFRVVGLVPGLSYAADALERGFVVIGHVFEEVRMAPGEVKQLGEFEVTPSRKGD